MTNSVATWNEYRVWKMEKFCGKFYVEGVPLSLTVDTSDVAVGAVLKKFYNNTWQPLVFSAKLNQAQSNYSTYDRASNRLQCGKIFPLHCWRSQTDHTYSIYASCIRFKKKTDKTLPRQARQLHFIAQFSTEIVHISGKSSVVADALSRIESITVPPNIDPNKLADEERNHSELNALLSNNSSSSRIHTIKLYHANLLWHCEQKNPTN